MTRKKELIGLIISNLAKYAYKEEPPDGLEREMNELLTIINPPPKPPAVRTAALEVSSHRRCIIKHLKRLS